MRGVVLGIENEFFLLRQPLGNLGFAYVAIAEKEEFDVIIGGSAVGEVLEVVADGEENVIV